MSRFFVFLTLLGLTLTFTPLPADQILLEEVMTKEEQKRTGVYKMTMQQKIELEAWLNKNFILKNAKVNNQTQISMSININNGQKLQLSDNSIWEVDPNDVSTAAIWITAFPVQIAPSQDPAYPFLIINTNTGVSVKVKKASDSAPTDTEHVSRIGLGLS